MMESVLNRSNYDDSQQFVLGAQQHQPQLPDHFKCGDVYTWLCAGELYAVECKLCEDHPLCPLSEFPQHMEVWHTDWGQNPKDNQKNEESNSDDDEDDNFEDNEPALSFTTEDSGLFEPGDQLQNERMLQHAGEHDFHHRQNEEVLQPFEQVLIEQDNAIDSIQVSEDVNDEECLNEQQKQVAEIEAAQVTEDDHKQKPQININNTMNERICKQREENSAITVHETELWYSQQAIDNVTDLSVNDTNDIQYLEKSLDLETKSRNFEQITINIGKSKRNSENFNEIEINEELIKENERNENDYDESIENLQNSNKIPKSIKQNLTKSQENKMNLRNYAIKFTNMKEISEIENEISDSENLKQHKNYLKSRKLLRKISKNIKQIAKTQEYIKDTEKQTIVFKKSRKNYKGTNENDSETNKIERETSQTERETNEMEHETSSYESNVKFIKTNTKIKKPCQSSKNNSQKLNQTRKSKEMLKENIKQLRRIKGNETASSENVIMFTNEAKIQENETLSSENETMSTKQTEFHEKERKTCEIARERRIHVGETENESEKSENEIKHLKALKTIQKNKNSNKINQNITQKQTKSRKCNRKTRENVEQFREINETESELNENGKVSSNVLETVENETVNENETQICTDEEEFTENETETNENESETMEDGSETELCSFGQRTRESPFNENIFELSDNETKTNGIELQLSANSLETSEIETYEIENVKTIEIQKLEETETIFKLSRNKTKNDSFKHGPQIPTKIRKSLRNLRKSKGIKTNYGKNSEEIQNLTTGKGKLRKNIRQLGEEKMKQKKINEIDTDDCEETKQIAIFGTFKEKNFDKSQKIRAFNRKLREGSREISQEELGKRKSRRSKRKLANSKTEMENLISSPFKSLNKKASKSNIDHLEDLLTFCTSTRKEGSCESMESIKESSTETTTTYCAKELKTIFDLLPKTPTKIGKRTEKSENYRERKLRSENNGQSKEDPNTKTECFKFEHQKSSSKLNSIKNTKHTLIFENTNVKTKVEDQTNLQSPSKTLNKEQNFYEESDAASNSILDNSILNSWDASIPSSPSKLSSQGYCSNNENSSSLSNAALFTLSPKTVEEISISPPNEPLSPLSPKTEEEHFEFYEPKEKLSKHHVSHLIKLYQEHPRLWDQSHPDFCEPQVCRKSWQQITDQWNEYCKRKFTTVEVRIRLGTLCQRYLQERERLALEGELDEFAKFPYYEQMRFLEQQKSLQKRRELYEQQNEKILEIYQNFPVLWHVSCYKLRQAKERAQAFESISRSLKIYGLHLSSIGVQKRIRSLRKCYRLEKIRFLHAQVEQTPFETDFRHYKRMEFLHKHIDPFVCRICGKIFENLVGFRGHLEEENHGSVLQEEECESESENDRKGNAEEIAGQEKAIISILKIEEAHETNSVKVIESHQVQNNPENLVPATPNSSMDFSSELENSSDILQTFTPLSTTPIDELQPAAPGNREILDNHYPIIQEVLIFPPNTPAEPTIDSLSIENEVIKEIMENVANNDDFDNRSLNHFDESVTNRMEFSPSSCITEETSYTDAMTTENANILPSADVLREQTLDAGYTEIKVQETEQISTENHYAPLSPLVVKVQCADFSLDLKLNPELREPFNTNVNDSDNDFYSSADISTISLPDHQIHRMIALYRKYPQLWNPNHLDYNSRNLRRQAWCSLTTEFNTVAGKLFSWRTMHRKLTDYAKYYKKLITDQEDYEELKNKWMFYEDFKFLDDVIAVHNELQRSVHHRDNNLKIIAIYETLPQLWDIKHLDFNKRSIKQRNFELMCNRLQEEYNLQLTTDRLKNRLIELRAQYRASKKQRLKCERNHQNFTSDFEFYEAFKFLDPHIDPFMCGECKMEFKKLTDYNQHLKREHEKKTPPKTSPFSLIPHEPGIDKKLENICHICGLKLTTRSNLAHHVRRHEDIRNYPCPMCPKKFFASHPLKVHIRTHTKECPYTCEKCGMSFVSASKLNQHVKRHYDKKDFQCDYCPKAFYTGFEKDRHERRHLNIRDKVCPICGKTFVVGSSYYAHMMLHSDTKRFECDKCDMKFAQYSGLYKHKKRHHS